jgi:sterol desaturase/sphingolipid hydroxylase (fatty acid hydroxylase superfamily)
MEILLMNNNIPTWIETYLNLPLGLAFVIFLPLEIYRRYRAGKWRASTCWEMLASSSPLIPTILLGGVTLSFIAALYTFAQTLSPWSIPTNGWTAALAFVLVDFLYYVDHRCGHVIRAYWAISHSVHHSSPQYDQTTGFRISFVDGFFSPWFYLPAVLIGFDSILVLSCFGFILAYQQWIHTETIGKLPWLDGWLNTPSNHRVHHGSQPQYLDKNYGAVLMIWDRLFGSYAAEVEPVQYGITVPINSRNPIVVHLAEAQRLWTDLRAARTWSDRWAYLWRRPGWSPAKSTNQSVAT